MSVTRINHFEAKKDTVDQLRNFMESVVEKVKSLPGCRSVRLLRSTENPAHLAIVEEWETIEDHQRAATTIPPDLLEKAKTLVAGKPTGEYYK